MATYEVLKGVIQGKKVGETVEINDNLAWKYGERYLKKVGEKNHKKNGKQLRKKAKRT